MRKNYLFKRSEWGVDDIDRFHEAADEVAREDLGLSMYPVQHEVITAEQMLELYSTAALPVMYPHWSFGKSYFAFEKAYRAGKIGLAYEIVLNSDPCIVYLMKENTMSMQALTISHASCGHNDFFKNNTQFRLGVDAKSIVDYCVFAKDYIRFCEERYGEEEVETLLDAAHAIRNFGKFRTGRKLVFNIEDEETRARRLREEYERTYNVLWSTLPRGEEKEGNSVEEKRQKERKRILQLPEENLLYFIEKNSPALKPWQREVLRIVRKLAQYFYPQRQTKVMNEGWAVFVHYYILHKLYDQGRISEGSMIEILNNHTGVLMQPGFDSPYYSGLNPYTLGYEIYTDIKRICEHPTDEDKEWFHFAGEKDWRKVLRDARAEYRDESFIMQFLSPHLIRKMRLFAMTLDEKEDYIEITDIHDEIGYRRIRKALAEQHDLNLQVPNIQVVDVNLLGDRCLKLEHRMRNDVPLVKASRSETLRYLCQLWGYDILLIGVDSEKNVKYKVKMHPSGEEQDETGKDEMLGIV